MHAIYCYDVVVWKEKKSKDEVVALFNEYAKHWVFQEECCPTTQRLHFQCRISLKTKKRMSELLSSWNNIGWAGCYDAKITANPSSTHFDYVTKTETRVSGPWADTDPKPAYIPRQVRDLEPLGWQKDVIADIGVWDTRTINVIVNSCGNVGKTFLCSWLLANNKGRMVPPMNSFEDLMKIVMCMPETNFYVFDVPRAIDTKGKDKRGIWSAIESIKNGWVWDNRYEWKERHFDCPNVWVFTNHVPDVKALSQDRWCFWKIDNEEDWKNSKLVRFNPLFNDEEVNKDRDRS